MMFVVYAVMIIAAMYAIKSMQMQSGVQDAKPAALSDLNLPNISATRFIRAIYGRLKITDISLIKYFDYFTTPIMAEIEDEEFIKAHKYHLTQVFVIGYGPVVLKKIGFGDHAAWSGTQSVAGSIVIDKPELFGPADEEGGVGGTVYFYPGTTTQGIDPILAANDPLTPAFRGVSYMILHRFYSGNSENFKPVWVEVERFADPMGDGIDVNIGNSANPAWMLLDINKNTLYGSGKAGYLFDETLMRAAAAQLADEGFGVALQFNDMTSLEDFEKEVFRYINGVWRDDFSTGKKYLHLVRGDIDVDSLPYLDENDIEGIDSYKPAALSEICTTVEVAYTDRDSEYKEKTVRAYNSGARIALGRETNTRVNYAGVCDNALAVKLSEREVAGFSRGLRSISLKTSSKKPHDWQLGQTIKLTDSKRLPGQTVICDIIEKNEGKLTDSGVRLRLVENRFAFLAPVFSGNSTSVSASINSDPAAVAVQYMLELPRWFVASDSAISKVLSFAASPTTDSTRCHLEYDSAGAYVSGSLNQPLQVPFTLSAAVDCFEATNFTVDGVSGELVSAAVADIRTGKNILFVETAAGGEFVGFESAAVGSTQTVFASIKRGLFDTVPQQWASGARVWVLKYACALNVLFDDAETVKIKHRTITARGTLSTGSATEYTHTINSRALLPAAPGYLKVNGSYEPASLSGDTVITWNHRDREDSVLRFHHETSAVSLPAGVTYTLKFYNQSNVLLRTVSGVTAETYTYTAATESADNGGSPVTSLRIDLLATSAAGDSYQTHTRAFAR